MANILLVEDDAMIRDAFSVILDLGKHTVTSAANGQIAIDLCAQNTYDLILLDLMMPVMDGIEFLKAYTAHYQDVTTKVIVMSNLSSGTELSIVQDFGIERVVLKSSLSPAILLAIVADLVEDT